MAGGVVYIDLDVLRLDNSDLYVADVVLNYRPGHYRLVLAAGVAPRIMLLPEVINELGLPRKEPAPGAAGGSDASSTPYSLHSIIIGPIRSYDLDVSEINWGRTHRVHGILGIQWFDRLPNVELDRTWPRLIVHLDP